MSTNAYVETYVNDITLILDNDETLQNDVREAVMTAVREDVGYPDHAPDGYDFTHRDRAHEMHASVGLAVQGVLIDMIESESSGNAELLLKQLVIDHPIMEALGENYLPTPDDYREWYEGQEG